MLNSIVGILSLSRKDAAGNTLTRDDILDAKEQDYYKGLHKALTAPPNALLAYDKSQDKATITIYNKELPSGKVVFNLPRDSYVDVYARKLLLENRLISHEEALPLKPVLVDSRSDFFASYAAKNVMWEISARSVYTYTLIPRKPGKRRQQNTMHGYDSRTKKPRKQGNNVLMHNVVIYVDTHDNKCLLSFGYIDFELIVLDRTSIIEDITPNVQEYINDVKKIKWIISQVGRKDSRTEINPADFASSRPE